MKNLVAIAIGSFLVLLALSGGKTSGDIIHFRLTGNGGPGLLESNVTPPTGELGTGDIGPSGFFIDTAANSIHIDLHWGSENGFMDLSLPVAMLHLHGPTPSPAPDSFSETADLLINIGNTTNFDSSPTGGGVVEDFFVSNAEIAFMQEGRSYINVHLSAIDTGRIRGYLVVVPEPASANLFVGAIVGLGFFRRRK